MGEVSRATELAHPGYRERCPANLCHHEEKISSIILSISNDNFGDEVAHTAGVGKPNLTDLTPPPAGHGYSCIVSWRVGGLQKRLTAFVVK